MIDLNAYDAAVLDMDGVITQSARAHFKAWKNMFDDYLRERAERGDGDFHPFTEEDYYDYVDGKPRFDGAQSFLDARGIDLPRGNPDDDPGEEIVCGLGNRKNELFLDHLEEHGTESYPHARAFVEEMKRRGKPVAAISSSRNAKAVLEAAGVLDLFDAIVDGVVSHEMGLEGKPAPDIFLEAARRLDVAPERSIVVEDARAGVEAGRAGGFGLVVGIDRSGENAGLAEHGADIVVEDLSHIWRKEDDETAGE